MHRTMSLRRVIDIILFALAFGFLLFTTLFAHAAAAPAPQEPGIACEAMLVGHLTFKHKKQM